MPQKRYDPHFKLYLPQHMMDALKAVSAATGITQQQICRLALTDYLLGPDPDVPNTAREVYAALTQPEAAE